MGAVLEGSPAQEAGLYADDEIVALDGFKVDINTLLSRCEDRRPGDKVTVMVFRRDKLTEVQVTVGLRYADAAYVAFVDKPSDAQKAAYQSWMGAAWDEGKSSP